MMQTTSRACCARMALALLLAVSGCHAASAMPPRAQRKSGAAAAARRTAAVGAAADVFLLDEESHFLAAVNVSGDASVMVEPTPSFTYEVLLTWALRWTLSADADATSVKQAWAAAACTVQRLVRPLLMPTPQLPASASIVSAVVDVTWPSDRGVSLLGARVCAADEGSAAVDASLEQRDALRALRHRGVTADSILRSRPNALLDASWGTHLHVLLKLEASGVEQQQFMPTFLPHLRDTFFHLLTASSAADDAAVAAACALNVSCQRALFTVGNVTHTLTTVLPSAASIMLAATSSAATVSVAMSTLSEAGLAQQLQQSLG
ncbi:MAG: hypothetical protein EOO41_05025, partial [Methanobacteriota archaeon]